MGIWGGQGADREDGIAGDGLAGAVTDCRVIGEEGG